LPDGGAGDVIQRFSLPYPPSLNNLTINVPGKGRVRAPAYRTWATEAGWVLRGQKPKPTTADVRVTIEVRRPNRRADIDGKAKALLDLLTGPVLGDDSQVVDLRILWAPVDGAEVTVEEVA
jgi:Holliday junction resolvase RusA-like endonuclease